MYIVHPASFTLNSVLQGTWKLPHGLRFVLLCLFNLVDVNNSGVIFVFLR